MKSRLRFAIFLLVAAMALGSLIIGGIGYAVQAANESQQPASALETLQQTKQADMLDVTSNDATQTQSGDVVQTQFNSSDSIGTIVDPVEEQTFGEREQFEHEHEHLEHERFEHEHEHFEHEGHEF